MRCLGLINARGGSKGIPKKNIKPLCGKPLIEWSIQAGLKAKRIDRVVVSTDSQEIADIAKAAGADVPFIRPPELAQDKSLQIDAIRHAIQTLENAGDRYDAVVILQPTCPMRLPEDIDGAIDKMIEEKADTVISVMKAKAYHPVTLYTVENRALKPLMPANTAGVLRQDFSDIFWRNGAIYAIRRDVIMQQNTLYGPKVVGYVMPEERSANIDEPVDWVTTEALMDYVFGIKKS